MFELILERIRQLITGACQPFGTSHTPGSLGFDDLSFFLAVLRAVPVNSTLHLHQCEEEAWAEALREWAHRTSSRHLEADHYRIDGRFIEAVELLLKDAPSSLDCVDQITVKSPDGRWLMASIDNFSIITELDEDVLGKLSNEGR